MTIGRQVINPTLVIGVGARGAAVSSRLEAESVSAGLLRLISVPDIAEIATANALIVSAFGDILSLETTASARATYGGVTPIDVFVIAQLGVGQVACGVLATFLASLEDEVRRRGELLRRADGRPRVHVSPILLLPEMPRGLNEPKAQTRPEQADIIALVRRLGERTRADAVTRSGLTYLVESATRDFVLTEEQRESMVIGFLTLLLFGSLRTDAAYAAIYEGESEPYGSFLVARIGIPFADLRPWCHARVRQHALEAFAVPREEELSSELTASFDVFESLDRMLASIETEALPRIESLATQASRAWVGAGLPAHLRLFEGPGAFLARAGKSWLDERVASSGRAWSILHATESGQRALVEAIDRDGAEWLKQSRGKVRAFLHDRCLGNDAPGHHRDALRLLERARDTVRHRLSTVAAQAREVPPPPRALGEVQNAHTNLLRAVEAKPEPRPLMGFGMLLSIALALVVAPLLGHLLDAPSVLIAVLVVMLGSSWCLGRLHVAGRATNRALAHDALLARSLDAVEPELKATLRRRVEIARSHGEARLLTRHLAWLDVEATNLRRAEESLGRAINETRTTLASLGLGPSEASVPRIRDTVLERSLLTPDELQLWTMRALVDRMLGRDHATTVRNVKRLVAPYQGDGSRAFEALEPLDVEVDRLLMSSTLEQVLSDSLVGRHARATLSEAISKVLTLESIDAQQGGRLQLPLEVKPSSMRSVSNRLVAHEHVLQVLSDQPEIREDSELAQALEDAKPFHDPSRVYVLRVSYGIPAAAIAWLGEESPSNVVVLAGRRSSEAGRS